MSNARESKWVVKVQGKWLATVLRCDGGWIVVQEVGTRREDWVRTEQVEW